jgi:hypothetical protein
MAWDRPHHHPWVVVQGRHCPLHRRRLCARLLLLLGGWFRGCSPLCMGIVWGVGRGRLAFVGMGGRFGWSWHVGGGSLRAVMWFAVVLCDDER